MKKEEEEDDYEEANYMKEELGENKHYVIKQNRETTEREREGQHRDMKQRGRKEMKVNNDREHCRKKNNEEGNYEQ